MILVRHRRSVVEVATFRTDVSYEDGRHPTSVKFTTAEEDARRRDFTINGLFLDPIENRVIDYVCGQRDINDKVLRAIGSPDERFAEDHLRLLRAVRFAARFDLRIDDGTALAIRRHATHLPRISPERIAEELRLMLVPPTRCAAWRLLWTLGLIGVVFRDMNPDPSPPLRDGRSLVCALSHQRDVSFGLALAAASLCYRWQNSTEAQGISFHLASDEVRCALRALRKLLRISNDEEHEVEGTLLGLRPLLEGHPSIAQLKRFLQRDTAELSIELLNAMIVINEYRERAEWLLGQFANLTDVSPPPLLTGDDLVARGLTPGPAFKRALDFVYDEQLEGRVTTRAQALELGERKVREAEAEQQQRPAR